MRNDPIISLSDASNDTLTEWRQLADEVSVNATLYPEWIAVALEARGRKNGCELVRLRDVSGLAAIVPFFVSRQSINKIPVTVMDVASNVVSYHNDVVSRLAPGDTLDFLLTIARAKSVDMLRIAAIDVESPLAKAMLSASLPGIVCDRLEGESSPYLALPDSWETLLAGKSKKFRYKARKRAAQLGDCSDNQLVWVNESNDVAGFLDAVRVIEANSWKKDAGLAIFDRPGELRYHEALLPMLIENDALIANVYSIGSQPAAYSLACLWRGWCGQMKTSFNTEFADLSPGALVVDETIKKALQHGATEFDFLGDKDPYKLVWTKSVREHATLSLFLKDRIRGRFLAAIRGIVPRRS